MLTCEKEHSEFSDETQVMSNHRGRCREWSYCTTWSNICLNEQTQAGNLAHLFGEGAPGASASSAAGPGATVASTHFLPQFWNVRNPKSRPNALCHVQGTCGDIRRTTHKQTNKG